VARIQRILDVPEHAIAASDAACAAIVKAKAKNFYYGMRLTPPDRRCHLYACYAWMRHADDQIDTAPDDAARRAALDQLYRQTHAALSGEPNRPDDSSFWPAFRSVVRSCPVEHRWLIEMLKGLEEDTQHQGYQTVDDMLGYCYRVGGTVGETCVAIWGLKDPSTRATALQLAAARGRAFQITNILRDIGVDARGGDEETMPRCYVPIELMIRTGVSHDSLIRWEDPAACGRLINALCELANEQYRASHGLERLVAPECASALWAMTAIYQQVQALICARPSICVQGRARLKTAAKVAVMVRAACGLWRT